MILMLWVIWLGVVTVTSLMPGDAIPFDSLPNDKLMHFTSYLVAGIGPMIGAVRLRNSLLLAGGAAALGGLIELAQQFVPYRSCDFADFVANTFGVTLGVVVGFGLRALVQRTRRVSERG
jgi:VanZ family protein